MIRRLLLASTSCLAVSVAAAQGCGPSNPNCIVPTRPPGDSSNAAASTAFVQTAVPLAAITALTGDVAATGPGSATATIQPGAVTSGKMAAGAAAGNVGTLGGVLTGTLPNPGMASGAASTNVGTLGGVLTGTLPNPGLGSAVVANSNLANMASGTVKCRPGGGSTGAPQDCSYPVLNLVDFGADPTGSADSATAFNNAFTAVPAAGGAVFCSGTFKLNSAVTISKPTLFYGSGRDGCTINVNFATGDVIHVTGTQSTLRDFYIASSVTRTSGANINADANYAFVENVKMEAPYGGILFTGNSTLSLAQNITIRNITPNATASSGYAVTVGSGGRPTSIVIDNLQVDNASGSQPTFGILVADADALTISNSDIIHSGTDIQIRPTTGQAVTSLLVANTYFDTCSGTAIDFEPSGTAVIVRARFANTWSSSCGGGGVLLAGSGGTLSGVSFVNHHAINNTGNGVTINTTGWTDVSFLGGLYAGNSGSGIGVAANVNNVSIQNADIGAYQGVTGNTNGILLSAGTSNNILIDDNRLAGNSTAISGLSGVSGKVTVGDNIGFNPWQTFTPSLSCGTATFTTNSARYYTRINTTFVELDFTITALGTCTAATPLTFTLPKTPNSAAAISGQEIGPTGKAVNCASRTVTTTMTCNLADATNWAVNEHPQMTGIYENQ